jgi:hypothetical protein
MLWLHRDGVYAGVIAWALAGILVNQAGIAPIALAAVLALAATVAGAAVIGWRQRLPGLRAAQ